MRLNAGILTNKIAETKNFYTEKLGFQIVWEADWFILLATPNGQDTISFLQPNHPTQEVNVFREAYNGKGIYLTIEVENVEECFEKIKLAGLKPMFEVKDESWGDRHFAILDPNNIGIDFVTHKPQ